MFSSVVSIKILLLLEIFLSDAFLQEAATNGLGD